MVGGTAVAFADANDDAGTPTSAAHKPDNAFGHQKSDAPRRDAARPRVSVQTSASGDESRPRRFGAARIHRRHDAGRHS